MTTRLEGARIGAAYSIGQLCREFDLTPRALRFYEEQGLLKPERQGQMRVYSHKDRTRLALIVRGRRVGLSVADIRDILDTYDKNGEAAQNAKALQVFAKRIAALEAQRKDVEDALQTLKGAAARLSQSHSTAGIAAE